MQTLILIPPSEGKKKGGEGPVFSPSSAQKEMITRLLSFEGDCQKLLGVKGKALEEAIKTNQNLLSSPTMPAIQRYSGVVYNGIDYDLLSRNAKTYFNRHVRIVSALLGLIKPNDIIPNYKLKIDKLDAAAYWKPIISKQLKKHFIIDLLPKAHRKAVEYENGLEVEFFVEKEGKRVSAGHGGKWIKGRFVRWLCEQEISESKDFVKFNEEGYEWRGEYFLKSN